MQTVLLEMEKVQFDEKTRSAHVNKQRRVEIRDERSPNMCCPCLVVDQCDFYRNPIFHRMLACSIQRPLQVIYDVSHVGDSL
jgi:hypothetical protein